MQVGPAEFAMISTATEGWERIVKAVIFHAKHLVLEYASATAASAKELPRP